MCEKCAKIRASLVWKAVGAARKKESDLVERLQVYQELLEKFFGEEGLYEARDLVEKR